MPDNRRNVQVRQPGIEGYDTADKNGWPDPLVSPLDPLKVVVTHGQSGTQSNFDPTSTSRQAELSLAEGSSQASPGNQEDQGGHGNKLHTSQQNAGDHHVPEGD